MMNFSPKAVEAVGHIVLAKLAADPKKKSAQSKLSKDLAGLAPGSGWSELLNAALEQLQADKRIQRDKRGTSVITPEGEARAMAFLRVESLPEKKAWEAIRNGHLMAVALGLPAPNPDQLKKLISAAGLKGSLLRSKFELKIAEFPSVAEAADALAWKLLGIDSAAKFTRDACLAALAFHPQTSVSGLFEGEAGLIVDPKKAVERIVTKSVGARNANAAELRGAAIRTWIESLGVSSTVPAPPPPPPFDLPTFAKHALGAARQTPREGRFGENKVFISHAWQASQTDPILAGLDLGEFKTRLAEANQARLLTLSRADLVEAMNTSDVQASEIRHMGASYHFILMD